MKTYLRLLLPLLPILASACALAEASTAGETDLDDDDQGSAESEIVGGCNAAPGCAAFSLLAGRSYLGRAVPNTTRTDVRATMAGRPSEVAPRTIAKKTSAVLQIGEGTLTLS